MTLVGEAMDTGAWVLLDKTVDVGLGIVATFLGVVLVYLAARPRIGIEDVVRERRVTPRRHRLRYNIRARNKGPTRIMEARASAILVFAGESRSISIPVPLSRDLWTNVKRSTKFRAAPRLVIEEVAWDRYVDKPTARRLRRMSMPEMMRALDASIYFRITAVSSVFGVANVTTRRFTADDIRDDDRWDC